MSPSPLAPVTLRDVVIWGGALLAGVALFLVLLQALQAWVKRSQVDEPQSGRGDWEKALADYKNLRDQGVLSDEEYRKIRTLVEPHVQGADARGAKPRVPSPGRSGSAGDSDRGTTGGDAPSAG